MEKFSITRLEEARRNPAIFAKSLKTPSENSPRFSKFMAWRNSVFYYHNEKNLNKSIVYLNDTYLRNFADNVRNRNELEGYIQSLNNYVEEISRRKIHHFKSKERISLTIKPNLNISGEAPLIFVNQVLGYDIYFLSKEDYDWSDELKFPIIQGYFAEFFDCQVSEVNVGIFSAESDSFYSKSFEEEDIKQYYGELNEICEEIVLNLED